MGSCRALVGARSSTPYPTVESGTMLTQKLSSRQESLVGSDTHSLHATVRRLLVLQAHPVQHHIRSDHTGNRSIRSGRCCYLLDTHADEEEALTPRSHRSSRPSSIPSYSSSQTMSRSREQSGIGLFAAPWLAHPIDLHTQASRVRSLPMAIHALYRV